MATNSMDFLELLRKRGMDGNVDFLREALDPVASPGNVTETSAPAVRSSQRHFRQSAGCR